MQPFLNITKALSDENRVRILLALREGELCLCHLIEMLGLAPSTVSKHVEILRQAGFLNLRKEGRWHFYCRTGREAPAMVREAVRWLDRSLADDPAIRTDTKRLCCLRKADPKELAACYTRN